ncbi:transketolase [Propylenella binzhouense]|uniref:Transketolase n=1 Tax=Propylenella binzhouense TaxID=2555902 RepID=A0A964WTL2_9HYPH|nr:transketolase [Propylenella binzhouense]MYZ48108.1 transketolase [Propylenella binzhouense]
MTDAEKHALMANAIRALAMDAVQTAKSGHPGLPMGAADLATVLFTKHLRFDPKDPYWPDRDRFVLSAGHGSMLLYSLLYLLGYEDMTIEQLKQFRQLGSRTAGHPEYGYAAGIETTTGPLGQGLATAVGMALAERVLNARFGDDVVDHYTYVLASDGDLMEGISQEAIALAGHLRLNRLIVIFDDNRITIDGDIALSDSTDQVARFEASGWDAVRIDGHAPDQIDAALADARRNDRPTLIAARTIIGYGAPNKCGKAACHGSPLGAEEIAAARIGLNWPYEAFHIPPDILDAWRIAGLRSRAARKEWSARFDKLDAQRRGEFERRLTGEVPVALDKAIRALKEELAGSRPKVATRKASELALERVNAAIPDTIGGSADLTGSNNTRTSGLRAVAPGDYDGRFVHYGIREHGMAAAMNGMALHGGLIPYSGTFLTFSDYCRPAIRLSALMKQRVVYVMTHDSIGLGEDGPTHQPVEQLAALRAMPNLVVYRPADAVETAECWQLALHDRDRPSLLALTRQDLPALPLELSDENRCARGAYVVEPSSGEAAVSLFATGSEVAIALAAKQRLDELGHPARVISVPSFERFAAQNGSYRREILGTAPVRVGIEAAVRQGWDAIIGTDGIFVGMHDFGASAPYEALYSHFGITPERVVELALARLAPQPSS